MDGYLLDISHLDSFQKWSIVCAAGLTILYAVMRPLKKKKDPLAKPPSLSLAGQREIERQMTELLVELEQMSRQMTAQLDTRAAKLQALIREADEKLAALRAANAGTTPTTIVQTGVAHTFSDTPEPRHSEVYALAEKGHTARQIARELDRPHGEIELILALRAPVEATAPVGQA